MSLLRQIQDDAVDSTVDISSLLRKCHVLAARLGHGPLKAWVQNELDGYKNTDDLPAYRIVHCQSLGTFCGVGGAMMKNVPIPLLSLPEKVRGPISTVRFGEGIGALADLVQQAKDGDLRSAWPSDLYPLVGGSIMELWSLAQAWRVVPRGAVVSIIETVRNRVLAFALEIEQEFPDAGETKSGSGPVSPEKVSHVFNTVIMGNVGNLANGSSDFSQQATMEIREGDWETLKAHLEVLGLEKKDIENLKDAIRQDGPMRKKSLGKRVSEWFGTMVSKGAQGVLKIGATAATKLLTQAIGKYYGIQLKD